MKIFITGATGYIGGSIAEKLVAAGHTVTGLVRSEEKARLLKARGIEPVSGTLDDSDLLASAARAADATIHTASADHPGSVVSLVTALERSGKLFIHTTGSAIVADHADGEYAAETPLDEDSYFDPVPYRRPRVDMNRYVRQAAIEKGLRAIVICPAMVYGTGRGLHPDSEQIPGLIGLSRHAGAGVYFGKGLNVYSNVHIDDLVDLYLLAMEKAPGGSFFFAENGHNSFREIAGMISTLPELDGRTTSLPLETIIQSRGEAGRLGVASNSYVRAANARRLGWSPHGPSLAEWFREMIREGQPRS
ncbi:MAG: NAD-dependent epimerase/dehydratase family protein [Parvibaculaceae bacterium]|nr:NAD-dependent epimerase/dehydratase family protein [Parvibaculaceae bacterium]